MGFAQGFRAGNLMVDSVLAEKRARLQDARTEEEFGWKRGDRAELEAQRGREQRAWAPIEQEQQDRMAPKAGLEVPIAQLPPDASGADYSDAMQGAAGMRAGAAQGLSMPPVGAPQPTVPVGPGQADQAAAGTATAPQPVTQAMPRVEQKLGRDQLDARNFQNVAIAKRDVGAYNVARQQEREADIRDIDNKVGKMSAKDRMEYAKANINLKGGMPMVVSKTEGGYTLTAYGPDGEAKQTLLNDAQLSELVASHMMGEAGYASEGFKRAGAIHKDVSELIGKYNTGSTQMQTANNQAVAHREQNAETARHHKIMEGAEAVKVGLLKDKAKAENNEVFGVGPEGITLVNKVTKALSVQPWPKDMSEEQKAGYIKKYQPVQAEPKVNSDGTVTYAGKLWERGPEGKLKDITPGASALDKFAESKLKGGAGAAGGPPAAGVQVPAAQQVPGRPLYSANQRDLERMAARPKGVSTAEANEAQKELDSRRGEARMQGM